MPVREQVRLRHADQGVFLTLLEHDGKTACLDASWYGRLRFESVEVDRHEAGTVGSVAQCDIGLERAEKSGSVSFEHYPSGTHVRKLENFETLEPELATAAGGRDGFGSGTAGKVPAVKP